MKDQKGTKKSSPYHTAASPRLAGALTPALLWRHLRSAFCEGHSRRLINRVAAAKAKLLNNANPLWERACPRWQHFVPPDRTRCLHRGQARSHSGNMPVADPAAKQAGRSAASGCSAFDLPALPGGREEVLWSGSTGMDAGRAAMGQGWPVAACPRSRTGAREPERSEGRTMGRGLFGSFLVLQKGTRRKGETNIPVRHECRICTQRIG